MDNYILIVASSSQELTIAVNKKIQDVFEPYLGPSCCGSDLSGLTYIQALVKPIINKH